MSKLLVTPIAEADLDEILTYIAKDRPQTATRVMGRIQETCLKIARFPEMGQKRPEFPGNYRSFPVQRWIIFYRIVQDTVQVHRILDGARDIDALLG